MINIDINVHTKINVNIDINLNINVDTGDGNKSGTMHNGRYINGDHTLITHTPPPDPPVSMLKKD